MVVVVAPPTIKLALAGDTVTVATGARLTDIVIAGLLVTVPLVAVIAVVPTATGVTTPLALIVATLGVPDVQVKGRPVSTLPYASLRTAV